MIRSISRGESEGFFWSMSAATPARCGQAMEVPDQVLPL